MKKHLIFAAIAAVGALMCSCQQELNDEKGRPIGKNPNEILFSLVQSGPETRSAGASSSFVEAVLPMGDPVEGYKFYLEETVEEAGVVAYTPETRGTPVYTENFANMFSSFYGVVYDRANMTSPVAGDGPFENMGSYWRLVRSGPLRDRGPE